MIRLLFHWNNLALQQKTFHNHLLTIIVKQDCETSTLSTIVLRWTEEICSVIRHNYLFPRHICSLIHGVRIYEFHIRASIDVIEHVDQQGYQHITLTLNIHARDILVDVIDRAELWNALPSVAILHLTAKLLHNIICHMAYYTGWFKKMDTISLSPYFKISTSDKYEANYIWLYSQWSL